MDLLRRDVELDRSGAKRDNPSETPEREIDSVQRHQQRTTALDGKVRQETNDVAGEAGIERRDRLVGENQLSCNPVRRGVSWPAASAGRAAR